MTYESAGLQLFKLWESIKQHFAENVQYKYHVGRSFFFSEQIKAAGEVS